jgi:hypothetical protein
MPETLWLTDHAGAFGTRYDSELSLSGSIAKIESAMPVV